MAAHVLGVDVGGTYTDAVIIRENRVLSFHKSQTTFNRTEGIVEAIKGAFDKLESTVYISRVCIGTTHFINAVVERSTDKLTPVAVVRLCGTASLALPPFSDFPVDLAKIIKASCHMVSGGLEYNGTAIKSFCADEIRSLAQDFLSRSPPVKNVVLCGVFSSMASSEANQELKASQIFSEVSKDFSVTLASNIGKVGLIERENAAILNESLKPFARQTMSEFKTALENLKLNCPFYLTQNDGTLISVEEAMEYPIFTFSSGSTNSMRGAMHLSGISDAIVIDIGGTTTDVGVLVNGFPREASSQVKVGGVRTNFRMPNVICIGLGGGSIVATDSKTGEVNIGPKSVGLELTQKACCFGGNVCTATDIAIAAGICTALPLDKKDSILTKYGPIIYQGMRNIKLHIEETIDLVKTTKDDAIVLLVGGGSILIDQKVSFKGASKIVIPPYFEVANAVGASLGMVSGQCDAIERLPQALSNEEDKKEARKKIVDRCIENAIQNARSKGSIPGTEYVYEKAVMNVTYVPDALDVHVKVIGSLQSESEPTTQAHSTSNIKDSKVFTNVKAKNWPYYSEEDKKLDNEAGLPLPYIDSYTGEWVLSEVDIECISIGAGILGCGGGGDPNIGRVMALECIKQGKQIKVINPLNVKSEDMGLLLAVAFMGAPVIINEKLVNGNESIFVVKTIQKILASEYDFDKVEQNGIKVSVRTMENGEQAWIIDHSTLPDCSLGDISIPLDKRITSLIAAEIGGVNSFEPLVVGARTGLPVLDADGMGRAFPELQMFIPFIYGVKPFPCCVADHRSNIVALSHIDTAKGLEDFFRSECIKMGMSCAVCTSPMTLSQVLDTCVLQSYSRAWKIGRAVMRAQLTHSNIVQAIAHDQCGIVLLSGKVIDVERLTEGGFTGSIVNIKGTGAYADFSVEIRAKNENILAQNVLDDGSVGEVLAVTPDLITIVDTDTGYPITTEDVKYGLRVSVLVLPADPMLLTDKALAVVGPSGFGLNISYTKPKTFL